MWVSPNTPPATSGTRCFLQTVPNEGAGMEETSTEIRYVFSRSLCPLMCALVVETQNTPLLTFLGKFGVFFL